MSEIYIRYKNKINETLYNNINSTAIIKCDNIEIFIKNKDGLSFEMTTEENVDLKGYSLSIEFLEHIDTKPDYNKRKDIMILENHEYIIEIKNKNIRNKLNLNKPVSSMINSKSVFYII